MSDSMDAVNDIHVGLGIRPDLFAAVRAAKPPLAFFEAHSENYFGDSLNRDYLLDLATEYPIALHGVGASLGRADALNAEHLRELRRLVEAVKPLFVSDHLAWSAYQHTHLPDLLPVPLTPQAFAVVCDHVRAMQDALGRQILVENPSNYALFSAAQWPESHFLNELAEQTGCGVLLDVNNVYVSASNVGSDPVAYIEQLESGIIQEYHLAGYTPVTRSLQGKPTQLLIDTHNHPVHSPVWELFETTVARHGVRPTLIEWDSDFPTLDVLLGECDKAQTRLLKARPLATATNKLEIAKTEAQSTAPALQHTSKATSVALELPTFQHDFTRDVLAKATTTAAFTESHSERVGIYQNNVFAALHDYLMQVYPAVNGVLGAEYFRALCHFFCAKYPPNYGDIHRYGAAMPEVLANEAALQEMPYLYDLALYEWALHSAYFSAQGETLDHQNSDQATMLATPLKLNASVAVIASQYPILAIHEQSLPGYEGEVAITLQQGGDSVVVYKQQQCVHTFSIQPAQVHFFRALQKSTTLVQAIESLGGSIPQEQLSEALSLCLRHALLNPC